jgi:hypothetical protein
MCNIHIITENKNDKISVFGEKSFNLQPHKKCLKFSMRKLAVMTIKSFISMPFKIEASLFGEYIIEN